MKATSPNGRFRKLDKCILSIPGATDITMDNLPEITDSKRAVYHTEAIIGRSNPLFTYSHSDTRTIGLTIHFFVTSQNDINTIINYIRAIQSAVYPREGQGSAPYLPPPVCRLKCGDVLNDLCVILENYNVTYSTEPVWDETAYLPYRVDVSTSWWVVYTSANLPFQNNIVESGR